MVVSVIVPVYNAEQYLEECIQCILAQSYSDYELILVNDGSTDRSGDICDRYAEQDRRIQVIHKENGGSASARNLGLDCAKGKYIAFVDADDLVHRDFLHTLVGVAEKYYADIVQCEYQVIRDRDVADITRQMEPGIESICSNIEMMEEFCKKSTYVPTALLWNKLWRAELFKNLRFPEGRGIDDEYLSYQLLYRGNKTVKVEQKPYYYFMSPNSQMRSAPSIKKLDSIEALEQQLQFFQDHDLKRCYNMLLYRYYSSVIGGCRLIQRYFPEEEEKLKTLQNKRRSFWKAVFVRETPWKDKIFLLMRYYTPWLFQVMHNRFGSRYTTAE